MVFFSKKCVFLASKPKRAEDGRESNAQVDKTAEAARPNFAKKDSKKRKHLYL
jgi:hypothetical protein